MGSFVLPYLFFGNASAFAPSVGAPTFKSRPLHADASDSSSSGGALVPIKEETIEFTAGIIGGAVGFVVGGPVLGAVGAAAANYVSKADMEASDVVQTVSKTAIDVYNYLAALDAKYEVLNKAKSSLESTLEKVKSNEKVDAETIQKVEDALAATTAKIEEINNEYDLVGTGQTAFEVIGELVEKTVKKSLELNEEYKLSEKATQAVLTAVEKAKEAASKASSS